MGVSSRTISTAYSQYKLTKSERKFKTQSSANPNSDVDDNFVYLPN